MNENLKDIFARLAAPFHPSDIEWRVGATNADKTKAMALAYITSRAVMDRLDEVIGPENWRDEYDAGPDGGVICGLTLRINGEWITKWDGAENTEFEAIKGGLSDAFKRAGYKWGIGRYLYKLDIAWVGCEVHGKTVVLKSTPSLPAWALPKDMAHTSKPPIPAPTTAVDHIPDERENQILNELGFEIQKPASAVAPTVLELIPELAGAAETKGNGNGSHPKPKNIPTLVNKRFIAWGAEVVQAVLKAKLANTPMEAVRLLNESDLKASATPEQAVARLQAIQKNG
jgi:hypothetical protein